MTRGARIFTAAAALALAACSGDPTGNEETLATQEPGNFTVAASLSGQTGMRTLATALAATQLATVLDGNANYTVLAPDDAAFAALGERGKALLVREWQPVLVAVLRGHILPGQVTPDAIATAIERNRGPVRMATMSGAMVTFARDDDGLTVSNGSSTARLSAGATVANNGAILPIDAVLLPASLSVPGRKASAQ